MKTRLWKSILCIVVSGCGQPDLQEPLQRQHSKSLNLTLLVEGDIVGNQVFPKDIYIEDGNKHKTRFECRDAASVWLSSFAIQPAWSPSHEWLLLPDGRFNGFAAFRAKELPHALADASKPLRVGVSDVSGIRWWHEFVGWKSPTVFEFRAGLSGKFTSFECDLTTGQVALCGNEKTEFTQLTK
jgi:hypothetical protein